MSIAAETAELVVLLKLKDQLSPGLRNIDSKLKGLPSRVSAIGSSLGTMGGKLKNVITGPLGLIGLGGAIFGVERFLQGAISAADEFGYAVSRVSKVTGLGVQETSALVDVLDRYGITADEILRITGFAEKNLDHYTKTTKEARKFQAEYGLELVDSKGKVKDFNQLLLTSADYFNKKSIPAQTKAAALAKIYGRNWQALIPILSRGSSVLQAAEKDAIKLTPADIANMAKFKEASREWDDAVGDLQITIGAKLLPQLTKLATKASSFVRSHSDDIVKFFKDAAKFAGQVGSAVQKYVIPAFQAIAGAWAKVPDDLKKVLIGGFIANKLTGGLVGDIAGGAVKTGIGAAGGLLGRGNSPAAPLFVSDVGGGVGGAGGKGGGGALGLLGKAFIVAAAAAAIAEVESVAITDATARFKREGVGPHDQSTNLRILGTAAGAAAAHALQSSKSARGVLANPNADERNSLNRLGHTLAETSDRAQSIAERSLGVQRGTQTGVKNLTGAVKAAKPPSLSASQSVTVNVSSSGITRSISTTNKYTRSATNDHGK